MFNSAKAIFDFKESAGTESNSKSADSEDQGGREGQGAKFKLFQGEVEKKAWETIRAKANEKQETK